MAELAAWNTLLAAPARLFSYWRGVHHRDWEYDHIKEMMRRTSSPWWHIIKVWEYRPATEAERQEAFEDYKASLW